VEKSTRKVGFWGWIGALAGGGRSRGGAGAGLSGDMRRDQASDRAMDYAFAVDGAAEQLNADERRHLRATGQVPGWFIGDVEQRVAEMRHKK
jgi:hypothetical protein